MKTISTTVFLLTLTIISIFADNASTQTVPEVIAVRLENPVVVDGKLSESVWKNDFGVSTFIQQNPYEGRPSTEKTVVRVAYDDEAIYVGANMYDSAPDSITSRLGRRDAELDADWFCLFIDPYNDNRSGFYFGVNCSGTYYDGTLYNDDWDDEAWDGIWDGKTSIHAEGWTAEFRIPFSQLRFQKKDQYVWGINFRRDIERKHENDYLVFTPKNGSGFVSRFPDLVGIENIKPPRNLAMLPYLRTKARFTNPDDGDPFNDGSRLTPDAGFDLKYGIGSNLTFDLSINPDFGQVEVDPAVVNLGDVETFFQEKRPFFIEGSSIFEFGYGGSRSHWGFNWGSPNFFYSRRIGRAPQGSFPDNDFSDAPDGARIISAAKLTGKLGSDWNFGAIQALTARESGDFALGTERFQAEVEPLTSYSVLRAQREIADGRQGIGMISTFTNRNFKDARLGDEINSDAFAGGLDGWTFLDASRTWVLTGWGGFSNVAGNSTQMVNLQRSSRHYFQRPDAESFQVDSSATSLNGYAGRLLVNKQKGNVIFNAALGVISPGFDVNDIGWMWRADLINGHIGAGYKWTQPGRFTRYVSMIGAVFQSYDFDSNNVWRGIFQVTNVEFLNYYQLELMSAYNPETVNNRFTRGGPLTINPPGWELNLYLSSDRRKPWVFGIGTSGYTRNAEEWGRGVEFDIEWKPSPNLSISIAPEFVWNYEYAQWVDAFDDPSAVNTFGQRYVFANMDQFEMNTSIRLNWTFTPHLSLQLFGQPLFSKGDYYQFKELARPKSYDFNVFPEEHIAISDDAYEIDPDGSGPASAFSFDDPDFNIKSLRGNAVLRWEYQPGSVLFFVWTQRRYNDDPSETFNFRRSFNTLLNADVDNIFMVKWTYWLNF